MKRRIIRIDEEKCNGCGACATACHEGAIAMVNGKARLMREDFCDGLGDCLPACPTGAITFEEREAPAYNEAAVQASKAAADQPKRHGGCPGTMARMLRRETQPEAGAEDKLPCGCPGTEARAFQRGGQAHGHANGAGCDCHAPAESQLRQWPVQIKLAPVNAPWFNGAKLLIAADCTAYAYAGFHEKFMRGRITLVGCPKLDSVDYADKLTQILALNDIKSVTVVRMEVPCCGGIENAVKRALAASGKMIPWQVVTISTDGRMLDD